MKINENFLKIESSYLFSTVAKKQREYQAAHPDADVIRLSIGDVTKPLAPAVIDAMHKAVDEMSKPETFHGYPPEQGYDFILETILKHDYLDRGISFKKNEIFLSDGAKSDCGNIGDIFNVDNTVAICDPVYPVYLDTNIMNGRKNNIIIMPCTEENDFLPVLPSDDAFGGKVADIIYLCFPNNPTGTVASKEYLQKWVDYANAHKSLILFDSAYEAFITDGKYPKSIYEIPGSKTCAIEIRSFSKTAGFTGLRCGYTVVPEELEFEGTKLNYLWNRRQCTKFNGVSYITQKAAEAVYTDEGQKQIQENLNYYRENAKIIFDGLTAAGFKCYGGIYSPYIWLKIPEGYTSWSFFDELLEKCNVVGTPGSGFGKAGEGYLRLTAFGDRERTKVAVERIKNHFGK